MKPRPEEDEGTPAEPAGTRSDDPAAPVRRRALDLLARREHAVHELARKLVAKGFDGSVVDAVLSDLERAGLVSDERFVAGYVNSRIERGFGPLRIRLELRERGVDERLAERILQGRPWRELLAATRRRRFGDTLPSERDEWARQARFLERRGFAGSDIRWLLGGGRPG